MKVLVVCSGNSGRISPFILEQVEALRKQDLQIEYFLIKGKGIRGYLQSAFSFRKEIRKTKPDLIHAHYGLSGLLANSQREVPVVTTFHGSDINEPLIRPFSMLCSWLSAYTIFISAHLAKKARLKKAYSVIPCGVDSSVFYPMEKEEARKQLKLPLEDKMVLFAGPFDDKVKNYPLAKSAVDKLKDVRLIELKGYTRTEVNLLMNACDVALMTSFHEGSPQFIKEAMACNTPVVSVNVGDVAERISGMEGCYLSPKDPGSLSAHLKEALQYGKKTTCRIRVSALNNEAIAEKIVQIYQSI